MSAMIFAKLASDEFRQHHGWIGVASALRTSLRTAPEVQEVREAIESGVASEPGLHRFVKQRVHEEFVPGFSSALQVLLAAVAVICEDRSTKMAQDYLSDLSRLELPELMMASNVGRICLRRRHVKLRLTLCRTYYVRTASTRSGVYIREVRTAARMNALSGKTVTKGTFSYGTA
jgi:hypothetical protein